MVCSTDGYCSLIHFARGELGIPYRGPVGAEVLTQGLKQACLGTEKPAICKRRENESNSVAVELPVVDSQAKRATLNSVSDEPVESDEKTYVYFCSFHYMFQISSFARRLISF